ncbi:MAG: SH3 domain-containing protein [Kiritimatiellae bacterium]|nr:SH3 domain-containing protein [Kiritimatiellia bacterium]
MKIKYLLPLIISTTVCSAALVEVTGDRVNLRSAAGLPSDVVGQVNRGDLLELLGSVDEPWVKVAPPQSVNLWISSRFVENGVVSGERVRVRAGASVNHKDVGIVDKGEKVVVRGKVGDWLKIAPPKTASVWITNAYVKVVSGKTVTETRGKGNTNTAPKVITTTTTTSTTTTTTTIPKAPKAEQKNPVKQNPNKEEKEKKPRRTLLGDKTESDDPVVGPAKIPQSKLRSDCKQAVHGSYTGRLEASPKNAPARFRLVVDVPGSALTETVCYVIGNGDQLKSISGQNFTFEGPVYWLNSTSVPTVYTKSITRVRK